MIRPDSRPLLTTRTTVEIKNGASVSTAVSLGGLHLVGLVMPNQWTSAAITFQAAFNDSAAYDLFDAQGSEVSVAAKADGWFALDPKLFCGFSTFRLRSGTTGTPVVQLADRTITLIGRPYPS